MEKGFIEMQKLDNNKNLYRDAKNLYKDAKIR